MFFFWCLVAPVSIVLTPLAWTRPASQAEGVVRVLQARRVLRFVVNNNLIGHFPDWIECAI
jgi:hypothetical protein